MGALTLTFENVATRSDDNIEVKQKIQRKPSINYLKMTNRYNNRRKIKKQIDIDCSACFQDCYSEANPVVYCSQCQLSCHKFCYGIKKIPKGKYFCDQCTYKKRKEYQNQAFSCILCSVDNIALKLVGPKTWAHTFCLVAHNLLEIKSLDVKLNQSGFEKASHRLNATACAICQQSVGLTIKCASCENTYFHPLCAYLHGLKLEFEQSASSAEPPDYRLLIYCNKHFPQRDYQKQIYYRRYALNYDDTCSYQSYESYKQ